jgi:hypothetical protein
MNETSGAEREESEPMPWTDACKLALVVMFTQIFVAFLTLYTWEEICAAPYSFLYKLIVFGGATFFVTFGTLIGISQYMAQK